MISNLRKFGFRLGFAGVTLSGIAAGAILLGAGPVSLADGEKVDTTSLEGKPAPEVSLKMMGGKQWKLSADKGSVVLMDYWATWCPPCRASLPHINELANDKELAAKGLKVYAINDAEEARDIKTYMDANKLKMNVPMDQSKKFGKDYLVRGIPTTVIVGRDGKIAKVFIGFGEGSAEQIKKAIETALEAEAPTTAPSASASK